MKMSRLRHAVRAGIMAALLCTQLAVASDLPYEGSIDLNQIAEVMMNTDLSAQQDDSLPWNDANRMCVIVGGQAICIHIITGFDPGLLCGNRSNGFHLEESRSGIPHGVIGKEEAPGALSGSVNFPKHHFVGCRRERAIKFVLHVE